MRYPVLAVALLAAVALPPGVAHADPVPPQLGAGCPADPAGIMTLLPDEQTYVVCERGAWAAAPVVFEPNDAWLSYGPVITLHGQGMRNPNVTSGEWAATPLEADTSCRAEQQTVVEAGVLSDPQVTEGQAGEELSVTFLPKLFYLKLSGNCLWTRDD